jgi:hypothetical protein
MAGLALGWLFNTYYSQGNDYWDLNEWGIEEYQLLVKNPPEFFTNLFDHANSSQGGFFDSTASFWNDLETNILIKALGITNIFSRGNYYINSLFFNFFGFFGHVALYKVFSSIYPTKKYQVITGCFLLPSALLFTSGINKDNVIFTLLCFFSYVIFFSMRQGFSLKRMVLLIASFSGLLLIRNYVALILLPGLLAWILSSFSQSRKTWVFAGTWAGVLAIAISVSLAVPSIDPANIIARKQHDFLALGIAKSQIQMDTLQPTTASLLRHAPQAFNHGFLRPWLFESGNLFTVLFALELSIYIVLVSFCITRYLRAYHSSGFQPFVPFIVLGSCLALLLIGYIVPNTHSIVRYRSIYLPFLMTPVLCVISFKHSNNA